MSLKANWVQDAAREIRESQNGGTLSTGEIIIKHCPFEQGVAYVPLIEVESGNIQDWATVAASYIHGEGLKSVSRTAAVIATFAKPLMDALEASRRTHHKGYNEESSDYPPCPCSDEDSENEKCNCGATEWNSKIDAVLRGAVSL